MPCPETIEIRAEHSPRNDLSTPCNASDCCQVKCFPSSYLSNHSGFTVATNLSQALWVKHKPSLKRSSYSGFNGCGMSANICLTKYKDDCSSFAYSIASMSIII